MLFKNKNKKYDLRNMERVKNLKINNEKIEMVCNLKFLGIYINDNLNWSEQSKVIGRKIARMGGSLGKLRGITDLNTRREIFCSNILSVINYCISIWGGLGIFDGSILQRIYERTIKKTFRVQEIDWVKMGKEYEIFSIENYYWISLMGCIFDRIKEGKNRDVIIVEKREQDRGLRALGEFRLPRIRTEVGRNSINYLGLKKWMELPENIKDIRNKGKFKKEVGKWLIGG